jgi:predicted CXXCH cytochrome family protein
MAILLKKPYDVCLDCHAEITKKQHAIVGFGTGRHPLGELKKVKKDKTKEFEMKELMDPARPGKPFYCGSCHDPHSTDVNKLFRFNARTGMDLCMKCHKM